MKVWGQAERMQLENIAGDASALTPEGRIWYDITADRIKVSDGTNARTVLLAGIGQIVNADVSGSAGLVYSKLSLANSILNADINASAAIAQSKMAALTASRAMATDGSGFASASSVTSTELGYVSGVTSAIQTQLSGKIGGTATAKVADYVVLDNDGIFNILMTTGAVDKTVTLPTAADNNSRILVIKKVDSGSGMVIVDGEGAETIDSSLTITLQKQYSSVELQCNGTEWVIIGSVLADYLESTVTSPANFSATSTTGDVASIILSPGDWEISAVLFASANGATMTRVYFGIGTVAGNSQVGMVEGVNTLDAPLPLSGTRGGGGSIAPYRVLLSANTTYYLKLLGTFSAATPTYTGRLSARKIKH